MTMRTIAVVLFSLCAMTATLGTEVSEADQKYIDKFLAANPKVDPPAPLESFATPAQFDARFMGTDLDNAIANASNDQGGLAWGGSYWMMALNDMYRATKDAKYLAANLRLIQAALAATDDKRGKKLWWGAVVPAWGCDIYAKRGRALFAVHTGIITAPMFEFLLLAKEDPAFKESLGGQAQSIIDGASAALATHERQWRDGPSSGEGHYIGMDQEEVCENKPLPGNRLSAMGWALWNSWKVTGNEVHRDRAKAIGYYIKNRLTPSPDGAYYWPYWLPEAAVTKPQPREAIEGEDASHASLTIALPLALAADGEVFTREDLERLAKTVTNGIGRLGGGILVSRITGTTELEPSYIGQATNWLPLATVNPAVKDTILAFYQNYKPNPGPSDLATLIVTTAK
ncbi:MAG: hypothetical protein QG656_1189 [Candidatus Hydrogenedentes bacterium]|nr:hypothetical protein [Candidatus Hydrogenedentota bacterium]